MCVQKGYAQMTIRKGLLHAVLSRVVRMISRNPSMPILQHVKLDADGSTLRVEATDLTTHIVASIPCEGRFSACLPGSALAAFIKPDDTKDKQSIVELLPEEGGKVTVAIEAALSTMAALSATDFPVRAGDKHASRDWLAAGTWQAAQLGNALKWLLPAVGTDTTRPAMTGVMFTPDEIVGLDGHRLHLIKMPGISGGPALLPGSAIATLLRVLPKSGEVSAERAKDFVRFRCATGDVQWEIEAAAMTDLHYPPFRQVIPAEGTEAFSTEVDREILLHAINRMLKPKGSSRGVRITVNGAIKLERDGDDGSTSRTVPVVSTTHDGPDSVIGIDAGYLADALGGCSDAVIARFNDAFGPIRIDIGEGQVAVIMPMRL